MTRLADGLPEGLEVLRRIDTGGTAHVYRAREGESGDVVALKVFFQEAADEGRIGRFLRETELIRDIDHPGIVRVRNHGIHQGRPFIVMDFVRGATLDRVLRRGPLEERVALSLCQKVCETIDFLHSRHIIHRDLKPSNIMVKKGGGVVLLDFGFMKSFADDEIMLEQQRTLGTPAYMAPEMVEGDLHDSDERTDIFSIGAVLYEMLAGVRAFPADEMEKVFRQILRMRPAPLRQLRPEISEDAEAVCLKSLSKKPDHRYESAKQMANALGRILFTGHL